MPKEDYEKFYRLWVSSEKSKRYPIQGAPKNYNDHSPFTTIRNADTTFIKTYQRDLGTVHRITIDILPLDVAPISRFGRKTQKLWALVYALFRPQAIPEKRDGVMTIGSKILLSISHSPRTRYKIWSFAEKQVTGYNNEPTGCMTEPCIGPRYMGNVYPAKGFESAVWMPFEDTKVSVPVGYDSYLSRVFGDYTQLPPEKDQISHHEAVHIDPGHSYAMYKRKHYLTEGAEKE